jgi:hypothetical protein
MMVSELCPFNKVRVQVVGSGLKEKQSGAKRKDQSSHKRESLETLQTIGYRWTSIAIQPRKKETEE